MKKVNRQELLIILGRLATTMESIEFQADCIYGEEFGNDPEENPKNLSTQDMWDCYDFSNWTSMFDNLKVVKEYLEQFVDEPSVDFIKE